MHFVYSENAPPPVEALAVAPGSITSLLELDFSCNVQGSHKLTLTAYPDSSVGAAYIDLGANIIEVSTIQQDYDGDTVPNAVADTITFTCVLPPTPTPTPTPTPANTPTPTDTPTPTPTKLQPPGDTDNDGCTDEQENGPDENFGGRRAYLNFWDFIDPTRDGNVDFFDFLALLRHYGTTGDPSGFAPDAPEPPLGTYWAAVDRGGAPAEGGNPWDELPPDGEVNFDDFLSLLRQYGHSCKAAP